MMFEKRKKLFEMKYKNTSAPKKEGSGKISENRSKQKTSDTDKDVSPFKTMQRAYYKRYLESVGDGKAMSFDEFVRAMNERASKSKVNQNENTSKNQASINDKFKMMREIQLKKLKMKYKR